MGIKVGDKVEITKIEDGEFTFKKVEPSMPQLEAGQLYRVDGYIVRVVTVYDDANKVWRYILVKDTDWRHIGNPLTSCPTEHSDCDLSDVWIRMDAEWDLIKE